MAQREDNPFLRLGVIGGVMGIICLFLWGTFTLLSPKAPTELAEEAQVEETETEVAEPDYQAQLAFRDQFHSLEKKPELQSQPTANELPPVTLPTTLPTNKPVAQSVPRPIPRPPAPRPAILTAPRPTYRPVLRPVAQPVRAKAEPEVSSQEQWQALANFGTGISSRPSSRPLSQPPNTFPTNSPPAAALLINNPLSQGELGILNRRSNTNVLKSIPAIAIDRGSVKAKIELPLVWDSSLTPEQQQSNQITLILEEPIYDTEENIIFDRGSVAIVEVDSINEANGLVTAYVTQIEDTTFESGELILRNQKKSALVAKASKRSNFGNQLLVGGLDTLSSFGQQILIPETNSTVSNGSAIVTSQSRNNLGRDLAGSALDGFGSSLSNELNQRSSRNQIGDGGTIFTLSAGTTVYLTNIQPIQVNR
jgi:hypothetical protein